MRTLRRASYSQCLLLVNQVCKNYDIKIDDLRRKGVPRIIRDIRHEVVYRLWTEVRANQKIIKSVLRLSDESQVTFSIRSYLKRTEEIRRSIFANLPPEFETVALELSRQTTHDIEDVKSLIMIIHDIGFRKGLKQGRARVVAAPHK